MKKQKKLQKTYAAAPAADEWGGPGSAGQSGDTQGLPDAAEATSESVRELVEEGQYSEAEFVLGVESANDEADISEVQTHEETAEDVGKASSGAPIRRRQQA